MPESEVPIGIEGVTVIPGDTWMAPYLAESESKAPYTGYTRTVELCREGTESLGLSILSNAVRMGGRVASVVPDSISDNALDLKIGDRLVSINSVDVWAASHEEIVALLVASLSEEVSARLCSLQAGGTRSW